MQGKRNHAGIRVRHSRRCPSTVDPDGRCRCKPAYEAWVYSARDGKKLRKSFPTLSAAKGWRSDATGAVRRGTMKAPSPTTLREAADAWMLGAKDGSIRTRSGDVYKPSALRGYEAALRDRVLPELGGAKLADIRKVDVQDFADRLLTQGLDPSTIRNTLMPLRAIYRRAVGRGEVAVNPTTGVELPAVRGRRERIASPQEAANLIAGLPKHDRALWGRPCTRGSVVASFEPSGARTSTSPAASSASRAAWTTPAQSSLQERGRYPQGADRGGPARPAHRTQARLRAV